ncbi:MAG TPA: AI-2E family transporter [Stellaceae bacterium]|nr:AI-2E family transporter [Stellaceae bacterium]
MPRRAAWFWLGGLALLVAALWLLSGILLPFVAGCAIAYFLDPAVDRLERHHVPRALATALVLGLFFVGLVLLLLLVLPLLELEAAQLASLVPQAVAFGQQKIDALVASAQEKLSPEDLAKLKDMAGSAAATALGYIASFIERLLTSGLALANVVSFIVVTPVVSFFLLRDWDRIVARIDAWLPRRHAATIREQARLIDRTLAGFVHGQVLVGVADAIYYGAALSFAGLDFAVIIGILVGVLSFIPFAGVALGLVLALGLGLAQFGWTSRLAVLLAIFAAGYAVESNILSPRLVGGRVNLHPVAVIFAFFAFWSLFGFIGLLLAVPVAAVIGVLVRFAIERYLASPFYDPDH